MTRNTYFYFETIYLFRSLYILFKIVLCTIFNGSMNCLLFFYHWLLMIETCMYIVYFLWHMASMLRNFCPYFSSSNLLKFWYLNLAVWLNLIWKCSLMWFWLYLFNFCGYLVLLSRHWETSDWVHGSTDENVNFYSNNFIQKEINAISWAVSYF